MLLINMFATFFKIGLFTFGGGYAMIPLVTDEVVSHGWASMSQVIDFIGIGEMTPGPFAVNLSTFVGYNAGGFSGALAATIGVVLPSFIIILLISKYFFHFRENKYIQNFLSGLRPAVVGVILAAAVTLFVSVILGGKAGSLNNFDIKGLIIFIIIGALYFSDKKIHPVLLIIIAGVLGYLLYGLLPAVI